jgi:hypothetical protein
MNAAKRIDTANERGLKFQKEFEATVDRIANMRLEKCIEYGESRYEETDQEFNHWALFMDVHRKYIRLRQQLRRNDSQGMIETYSDLAAYALMAVQILTRGR